VVGLLASRFPVIGKGTDFPDFYCAARMVREGYGRQLYDAAVQRRFQVLYGGRIGTLYIHPPFETLLYLTVAWLPLYPAYVGWCLVNLLVLAVAVWRIARDALPGWDWRVLLVLSLTFVPVLLNFVQGQDAVVLLLLVVLAFGDLQRDRRVAAGCWLGLGLFKFHLVLPLALVLALRRGRLGFAAGFTVVAAALVAASVAISGWNVFTTYPHFLLHLREQPLAGAIPEAMANLRGMVHLLLRSDTSAPGIAVLLFLSAGLFGLTLWEWRRSGASVEGGDLAFSNTIVFALLAGYHLNPHDLSLLLLPLALALRYLTAKGNFPAESGQSKVSRYVLGFVALALFLPPLHLLSLYLHAYVYVVVPLFALFAWNVGAIRQARTVQAEA